MAKRKIKSTAVAMPEHDWQAEDDMRTLMRAHEIRADPKRHGKAKALAKANVMKAAAVAADPGGEGQVTAKGTGVMTDQF